MTQSAISVLPLVIMMFVASITPGPNNLMLMIAGTNFGFWQTIPHLLGVTCGAVLVICLTYAGLGTVMLGHPRVIDGMTMACGVYLLWMASRLLRPTMRTPAASTASAVTAEAPVDPQAQTARRRPMRFIEAVLFQFINPKVWTMAVATASIAASFPFSPLTSILVVAMTTAAVNSPCIALWAAFGKVMRHRLDDVRVRRLFDGSMALLVVATAIWIVWPLLARVRA